MSGRDANIEQVLALIDTGFAEVPRPPDEDLLHERCMDDNDIRALYAVAHWRDMPDSLVESEYAALSFLSPSGFRHFVAAYLRFALTNLESGAAAVDSTIWSLSPEFYDGQELREFVASKLVALDDGQRAAVIAFLEAVQAAGDEQDRGYAETALRYWED
jgi:hypothetical protein